MLGNIINEKLKTARNWPSASAISVVLTIMTTGAVILFSRLTAPKRATQVKEEF
jgi:spermidine/putrescine transport system permease protein